MLLLLPSEYSEINKLTIGSSGYIHEPSSVTADASKLTAVSSVQPKYSQLPSSSVAVELKLLAASSVHPKITSGHGVVCEPKSDQSSISRTIHSESSALVPAEAVQSAFPCSTEHLRTKVWFWVALDTPATDQPLPGSPFQSPAKSTIV